MKLSKKHGVNPSIIKCFWCNKDIGIAMLGQIDKADSKAPDCICTSYEPCDECKEKFDHGITVMGVSNVPINENMPHVSVNDNGDKLYPTGKYFVTSDSFINELIKDEETKTLVLKSRKMYMEDDIVEEIINNYFNKNNDMENDDENN